MEYFKKQIKVDTHDVDYNGVCRASSLLKYIQSTAEQQLTDNGMSYDNLKNAKKAFIISRMHVEFANSVGVDDLIEATTFPCESRGFSFIRCYQLKRGGEVIARAISAWALVDINTRALVRVSDFDLNLPTFAPLDMPLGHFRMPSTLKASGEYTVAYADLDRNKHVNNTKYADIYANFIPLDEKRIATLSISYVSEAVMGEKLTVFTAEEDGVYYIRTVKSDGKINSEARITLTDI